MDRQEREREGSCHGWNKFVRVQRDKENLIYFLPEAVCPGLLPLVTNQATAAATSTAERQ
jgi:hypothetical protein